MKRLALLVLVSLAAAGAVGAQTRPPAKVVYPLTTKDVSVGLSAHTSIPLTLGYWKAEGLDVEVTTLEGSTAGLQQLAAGNIHFATVGPEVALIAREKGVKVKSFYVVSGVTIFRVVVPKDSAIQTVADLRGKTIGCSALTSGAVPVARALLASGGVDPDKDVKWIGVGTGAPAAVALNGQSVADMTRWGDFPAAQWSRLFAIYKEQKLIQGTVDVHDVFTSSLVDEVNRFDAQAVIRQAKEYR